MNADEYRAMIELAKNAGPEECEMWIVIKIKIQNSYVILVASFEFRKKWKIFIPCLDLFSVQEYSDR
jgi:hypothetical protein